MESDGISDVVGSDHGDTVSANSLDNVIDTRVALIQYLVLMEMTVFMQGSRR